MPYKDLQRKKEWELRHRPARLARRRELRRIQAARKAMQPASFPWILLIAAGALASYSPAASLAAGALTLVIAALGNKRWQWWVLGASVLILSIFFLSRGANAQEDDRILRNCNAQ